MKATSVLFGDLADLFQDSHIEDAQAAAESAQSSAHYVGRQVAVLRQRVMELERDNALLAVVLLQALKQLEGKGSMSRSELTASLREELTKLREQKCDDFLSVFREALALPKQKRTEVAVHKPARPASAKGAGVTAEVETSKPGK
jgi:hypothetical protein